MFFDYLLVCGFKSLICDKNQFCLQKLDKNEELP